VVGGRGRRARAVTVLLLLTLAACSKDKPRAATPGATVPTAPPFTTTTTTDPYAVPSVIDATYVNRVLAGLDEQEGAVVRLVIRDKTISMEVLERLKAIYASPSRLQLEIDALQLALRNGMRNYLPQPGTRLTTVERLISSTSGCIFAQVRRDYAAVGVNPEPPGSEWVGLKSMDRTNDPRGYNNTGWAFVYDGFPRDRSEPPNPCSA
jgi:hypothetical protein